MSPGLNEKTAIFIGCVIGFMILIVFGLILWYCYHKNNLRSQQQNDSKYKKITSEANDTSVSHSESGDDDTHNTTNPNINVVDDECEYQILPQTKKPTTDPNDDAYEPMECKQEEVVMHVTDGGDKESVGQEIESETYNDEELSINNSNIGQVVLLAATNVVGNKYNNTQEFDDQTYLDRNQLNLSRVHLHCIKYWTSNEFLLGIECEWNVYDNEGGIVQKVSSDVNYEYDDGDECLLKFGEYLYGAVTVEMDKFKCINSISFMSQFGNKANVKKFGGHGSDGSLEQNMKIPEGHILLGFRGGYGQNSMHNIGVVSIHCKHSVCYDLIKLFLHRYQPALSDQVVGYILDYVFCLKHIIDEAESVSSRSRSVVEEEEKESEDVVWEQPRSDAKGTCVAVNNYNEKRAMQDAKIIRQALGGIDDDNLLEITGNRSHLQRIMIKNAYKKLFEKTDLLSDIEKELNRGATGLLFCSCYRDIGEFDARLIYKAMSGEKLDKYVLNEIVCTRTNNQINKMKNAWNKLEIAEGRSMDEYISNVIDDKNNNNDYKDLLVGLLNGDRFPNQKVFVSNIREYAEMLFNDKRKRKRNQKQLCEILSTWSWSKIAALAREFNKLSNNEMNVSDVIQQMFDNNDLRDALCVIVEFCEDPYSFWSEKIKESMSGIGTRNDLLMRCIVSRCEIDLYDVRNVFDEQYGDGATLQQWIEQETTGFYQELLVLLCGYRRRENVVGDVADIMQENVEHQVESEEDAILSAESSDSEEVEEKIDAIEYYKDIQDEHVESLLCMKMEKSYENPYLLGDRTRYKIPKKKREFDHLERDLRRLTAGLNNVEIEDRKFCKLVILKFYELLCATFRRYCLIGGDKNWLTPKGWNNLYRDAFVVDNKSEFCKDKQCKNLFEKILAVHDNKKHRKNIESDWNGVWKREKQEDGEDAVIVKIKQMSDYKLKGYIKSFDFCDINGVIKHDTNNKQTKRFIILYQVQTEQNKAMRCDATLTNENKIEIAWQTIEESAVNNEETGSFVLSKIAELTKEDNNLFKSVYGLLRYEFFDILLCLSQMKFPKNTHKYKFQSLLKLMQDFVTRFIWDDINSISASKDSLKWLFKKDSKSLSKLFKTYCKKNVGLLNEREWKVLCSDIFNKGMDGKAFKKGKSGKPTQRDISQSFQLAKTHLYHSNLRYNQFEKALQNLAHKMYKKKPQPKYQTFDYQDKLKKILQWAAKLQRLNEK